MWANGLLCGEALSASLTIPLILPLVAGAWGPALAVWGIPVAATAIAFGLLHGDERPIAPPRWFPDFRDARVWRIGLFQSAASLTYFGANTFIPDYLNAAGRAELVGPCLAALNIGQLPATLVIGLVPLRVLARRLTSTIVALLIVGALLAFGLVSAPVVAVVAATAFGLAGAYILAFSFAMPAFLARGPEVTRIAAGTNTIGYAIAFAATVAAGALWDAYHQPALAGVPVIAAAILVLVLGSRLGAAALAAATA